MNSNMSTRATSERHPHANLTVVGACRFMKRTVIGFIAPQHLIDGFGPMLSKFLNNRSFKVKTYTSRQELEEFMATEILSEFCFALEFSDIYPGVPEVNVTYMLPLDVTMNTASPLYDLTAGVPDYWNYNSTFHAGTLQLKVMITDLLINLMTGHSTSEIELAVTPFKTPEFSQLEPFASQQLTMLFPFFYMCVFLLPLYYLVTKLAEEKESKAREGMKMMGLQDTTYFAAWFIFLFGVVVVMSLILTTVLKLQVLSKTSVELVFLMSIFYGMSLFGFAFAVVAFFPSRKASATVVSLVHILSYVVAFKFQGYSATFGTKLLVSLIPNCALAFIVEHLFHCEHSGSGLSFETAAITWQNFSFMAGLAMLAIDVVFYLFLGYYCDQVAPRDVGLARPWNFPCQSRKKVRQISKLGEEAHSKELVLKGNFEKVSDLLSRQEDSLQVRGLKKVFADGKIAVDDTSMTMYSGQIFALLGHNGAGKTTTISMLTGLLEPTAGEARAFGVDCFDNMDVLRENLGVCPQHNVLFDYLTVREHLALYAGFKGVNSKEIASRVDRMIYQIELSDIQHQIAKTLSGGQKRKLSVGIALIGDSKIVMLDEPTSGMDTTTRRRFWQLMKQYKQNRIVILTTHYMDEADVLGDRICILAEGKVQCCGSSLFLKKQFGVGYNLVVAKKSMEAAPELDAFVKQHIPEATKLQEVSHETTFQFPKEVQQRFKTFFNLLDKNCERLGINSYGVSQTTLEEVFLRIGHGEDDERVQGKTQAKTRENLSKREQELTAYTIADEGSRSFFVFRFIAQCLALVKKRLLVAVRDRKSFLMDTLFPMLLIFFGLYCSTLDLKPEMPLRSLSALNYPQGRPLIINKQNFNQTEEDIQGFVDMAFGSDIGPGKLYSEKKIFDNDPNAHFFDQLKQQDSIIFEARNETGPQYGQFFIQQANKEDRVYSIAFLVNSSSPISPLAYGGYACQAVMRDVLENPNFKLTFFEKPLPLSLKWSTYVKQATGVVVAISFAVAYMLVSDTLVQVLIRERENKIKHQIILSGSSKVAYWVSNYIVDVFLHAIPAVTALWTIQFLEIDTPQMEYLFQVFTLVNPIAIYAVSNFFNNDMKASIFIRIYYFAFGGLAPISVIVLKIITKETAKWGVWLDRIFKFCPVYNLDYGYLAINNRKVLTLTSKMPDKNKVALTIDAYHEIIAGGNIENLEYTFYVCLAIFLLVEGGLIDFASRPFLRLFRKFNHFTDQLRRKKKVKAFDIRKATIEEEEEEQKLHGDDLQGDFENDNDPLVEEKRCENVKPKDCSILVSKLSKSYTIREKAVDCLSFGLQAGECFALLGVTGAGKTTTFKCLTGEEVADEGSLYMGGSKLDSIFGSSARRLVGYCPQFDAIFEQLTVREHLDFYASIKGVRQDFKEELILKQMKEMDLFEYQDVYAGKLSGGNKRKLSCAMALLGNPPFVLLDEPSTGVDPQAKRFMWTIISEISTLHKKSTVILTTHSMEEAEALCPKMGIMVNGQFKCFGSSQHIKNKYGKGFEIEVKFKALSEKDAASKCALIEDLSDNDFVSKDDFEILCQRLDCEELVSEVEAAQLDRLFVQDKVQADSFVRWAFSEKLGLALQIRLKKEFKSVIVSESVDNLFKLRVSRDGHSVGFVFGLLEEMKPSFNIDEYSANQTTLEQIFNVFARQARCSVSTQDDAEAKKNN